MDITGFWVIQKYRYVGGNTTFRIAKKGVTQTFRAGQFSIDVILLNG